MAIYSNFESTAVKSIETLPNTVKVVYNTNESKEYTFDCEDVLDFANELCSVLIDQELGRTGGSVGRFLSRSVKNSVLTPQ
tara:strand:+ start:3373 stop:3615 length:243 start_codon:yes stop_codon:yes gene_type:complete